MLSVRSWSETKKNETIVRSVESVLFRGSPQGLKHFLSRIVSFSLQVLTTRYHQRDTINCNTTIKLLICFTHIRNV